jgi:hypothetical protein
MCGDHSCFREVFGLLMLFRIIGGLLLFQNQAQDQGYIFTRAKECSKRMADILELWVMIKMSSRPDHCSGGENVAVSVEHCWLLNFPDPFLVVLSSDQACPKAR